MRQIRFTAIGFITFLGMVTSATADESYEARITYNPNQPATEIYESLNQSIRAACQIQYRKNSTTSLSRRFRIKTDCQHQYMNSAIETINMPELIALHDQAKPGRVRMSVHQFASQ